MKKFIGIIILIIAIILIVRGLKTQKEPDNVAIVDETTTQDTDTTQDTANPKAEEQTEEVGTNLPIAEENTSE